MRCESLLGCRGAEGIEVHADEVDQPDPVLSDRREVLRQVAAREESAVDRGVQRLHAAVEHLRELREICDVTHFEPSITQRLGGAASRDKIPLEFCEPSGEIHEAGLVGYGEQGGGHGR